MPSFVRLLGVSVIALVASACVGPGAGPTSGPSGSPIATGIAYPAGATDLVLRLRYVGGFAPPAAHMLDIPVISVYGDGTVIVPGPQIELYPGPALPNLQRATITPAGIQILLEAVRDAGLLGPDAHYDLGGIMDASSAEFTVNADGRIHTVSAYALMEGGDTPQGTDPAVAEARAKLANFQAQLGSLEALLGSELGSWSPFQADAVQLLVSSSAPDDGQGLSQQPVAWPLTTPLGGFGTSLPALTQGERCGVVSGSDLDLLRPLLAKTNTLTPWTDDGASFGIAVRPLLPAEAGCSTAAE
ncbi:MAG: hypothetical protein Q7S35_03860 [Candidatus Limnocylindrales bacterium]|nr:hypothetical protein [Candidatus Limnocylindrales bacterium]